MKLFLYILLGIVISYAFIAMGTVGFILGLGCLIGVILWGLSILTQIRNELIQQNQKR